MTKTGTVFNIQRFSVQDGPGIRTLVFLKGCPLRCLWCCNPESQNYKPDILFTKQKCIGCGKCIAACAVDAIRNSAEGKSIDREKCTLCGECVKTCYAGALEIVGEGKTVEEVMDEVLRDTEIYRNSGGGVTLSGGEPMFQPAFAAAILKECQLSGIHTAIETCGFAPWSDYEEILPYVDLFLFDIKHMNSDKHEEITCQPNELIINNFKKLAKSGKRIIARIPLIPGRNTLSENIKELSRFLSENGVREAHLLPYHKLGVSKYSSIGVDYKLNDIPAISDVDLDFVKDTLESFEIKVTIYNHS